MNPVIKLPTDLLSSLNDKELQKKKKQSKQKLPNNINNSILHQFDIEMTA